MKLNEKLLRRIESDLRLNELFVRGQEIPVKNCWHFSTDGKSVDILFYDEEDFIAGMNRIYITLRDFPGVVILAFCLMDTHIHFILYGPFDACNRFMHEFVRKTSHHISRRHGERHKLENVPIDHQVIDDQRYLKTAICYTVKNPPVAGMPYMGWDYPWSSGPLYFRTKGTWCSPVFLSQPPAPASDNDIQDRKLREQLQYRNATSQAPRMSGNLVYPGDYVAWELVERIFKTFKSYNYFMCFTKEENVDSRGGSISRLSIPLQEMRQHKNEVCLELFGTESTRTLTTEQRLKLAKVLRSRYNSSSKQIARVSGLVYDEIKDRL